MQELLIDTGKLALATGGWTVKWSFVVGGMVVGFFVLIYICMLIGVIAQSLLKKE